MAQEIVDVSGQGGDQIIQTLFNEKGVRVSLAELLDKTGAKESDTREKLWIAYNVVSKVEQHLKTILETGKLAEKQLEDFRKTEKEKKF